MASDEDLKRSRTAEARARSISQNVRCTECGSQSIEESQADVAILLRKLIRDEVSAGKSDKEIYKKLEDDFGETVLYAPKFDMQTAALWLSPVIIGGIGVGFVGISKAQAEDQRPYHGIEPCSRGSLDPKREGNNARASYSATSSKKVVVDVRYLTSYAWASR